MDDLWWQVAQSATKIFRESFVCFAQINAEPKVNELNVFQVLRNDDIVKLDVPMRNRERMQIRQPIKDALKDMFNLFLLQIYMLLALLDQIFQRHGKVLQHQIHLAHLYEVVIVPDDIAMFDLSEEFILCRFLINLFNGDKPIGKDIFRLENLPGHAFADDFHDLVAVFEEGFGFEDEGGVGVFLVEDVCTVVVTGVVMGLLLCVEGVVGATASGWREFGSTF